MSYRVVLQRLATQDLTEAYQWAAERAPLPAARWLDRFQQALQTLKNNPERCPLARENEKVDIEVREFLFGKRPYVFRVIFMLDNQTVRIFRIRRAQRKDLSQTEIGQSLKPDE